MKITETDLKWHCALEKRRKTKRIVICFAHGPLHNVTALTALHLSGGRKGFEYHFLISKAGEIFTGRPIGTVGVHLPGKRADSIDILLEAEHLTEEPPASQLASLTELVAYLMDKYPTIERLIKYSE